MRALPLIEPEETINNDFLEQWMLEGIPRESKKSGDKAENEFVSIKKNSRLEEILSDILKRDKVDKILSGKRNVTKKDLVFMNFFKFTLLTAGYEQILSSEEYGEESSERYKDQEKDPILNMYSFREETDDMLSEIGMGTMYIPNRFDNLILLSLCFEFPYEYFSNILEESFPKEKVGEV